MSTTWQMELLKNLCASAEAGSFAAGDLLRTICVKAAEQAPVGDLVKMGRFLEELHDDELAEIAERN